MSLKIDFKNNSIFSFFLALHSLGHSRGEFAAVVRVEPGHFLSHDRSKEGFAHSTRLSLGCEEKKRDVDIRGDPRAETDDCEANRRRFHRRFDVEVDRQIARTRRTAARNVRNVDCRVGVGIGSGRDDPRCKADEILEHGAENEREAGESHARRDSAQ